MCLLCSPPVQQVAVTLAVVFSYHAQCLGQVQEKTMVWVFDLCLHGMFTASHLQPGV